MQYGAFFGQNAVDQAASDYHGWAGNLAGCVPDARGLAIMFADLGYDTSAVLSGWNIGKVSPVPAKDWVLTLDCTRKRWIETHERLQSMTKANDCVILGNSGHGYQYDTPFQFNGGQGMCFADGLFTDREQHDLICQWRRGVRVIYVIDTCYSGGADRDRQPHWPRVMPLEYQPMEKSDPGAMKPADVAAQVLWLRAAGENETAADGRDNGAFTGTFLSVLATARDRGDVITPRSIMAQTQALMGPAFAQHPDINILGAGAEIMDTPL